MCSHVTDFNTRNPNFYSRAIGIINFERLSKNFIVDTMNFFIIMFNVGLKTLLHQGLSETEFYVDVVYTFMKLWVEQIFDQFRKNKIRY